MKFFFKKIKFFLFYLIKKIFGETRFNWYFIRRIKEKNARKLLINLYSKKKSYTNEFSDAVINLFEGGISSGGLADRLRGILSTYYICKNKKLNYKLFFISPFKLEEFLVPAEYDWRIAENVICRKGCELVLLDTIDNSNYHKNKQKKYLESKLKKRRKQIHVYTNAAFSYDYDYYSLFNELFKPSKRLEKSISYYINKIGKDYISVSTRFMGLLGDFNETSCGPNRLSEEDSILLLNKVLKQVESIHTIHPNKTILLTSDSCTFLDYSKRLPYVYIIPGNITHIDNKQDSSDYEKYEKTFIDFFMIANANEVFLIRTGKMMKSGFSYAASKVYNKKFNYVEF